MRLSHFFIDRPIFASVVSIVFVILGAVSFFRLPIAQYPEIAPPIINVSGQYPGASAEIVASTVVAPIEEQINGVENMLYVSSNATADGRFSIAVTFDLGTNLDIAQVQVQNRVATATPRLPADVRNIGVTVSKSSPDLMMVVHLYSPDRSRDTLFISNFATLEIKDPLARINGVGSITVFGSRDYSMRIWLDPQRLESLGLTASDVTQALVGQNVQVASGVLNQPPVDKPGAFQIAVKTQGRLDRRRGIRQHRRQADRDRGGAAARRRQDRARGGRLFVEFLSRPRSGGGDRGVPAAGIERAFDRAGNPRRDGAARAAVSAGREIHHRLRPDAVHPGVGERGAGDDPRGDPAGRLVVIIFLQTWRAAVIPLVAIPVSLIGTFFFMAMFGFTLNNLTLFGLVLAVGIVVDDAIVVVENVERNIEAGLRPREAAIKSMDEVGGALIAIALVLCAVFIPAAFITGISGQFYRQFALTIAGATVISLIVSLTLSPALAAMLLKPHERAQRRSRGSGRCAPSSGCSTAASTRLGHGYGWLTARVVRFAALMLVVYVGILAFGLNEFRKTPTGFIPAVDRGFLIIVTQLPPGAALHAPTRSTAAPSRSRSRHRAFRAP